MGECNMCKQLGSSAPCAMCEIDRLKSELSTRTAQRDSIISDRDRLRTLCDQGNTALAEMREERNEYRVKYHHARTALEKMKNSKVVAKRFHETYERLAPDFGYKTRKESAVKWEDVPVENKWLMEEVCAEVISTPATTALDHSNSSELGDTTAKCENFRCKKGWVEDHYFDESCGPQMDWVPCPDCTAKGEE